MLIRAGVPDRRAIAAENEGSMVIEFPEVFGCWWNWDFRGVLREVREMLLKGRLSERENKLHVPALFLYSFMQRERVHPSFGNQCVCYLHDKYESDFQIRKYLANGIQNLQIGNKVDIFIGLLNKCTCNIENVI